MEIHPGMSVWKNYPHKQPKFSVVRDFSKGDVAYETDITFNLHTGTHIDAPLHFVEGGDTFECIPLENLVTRVRVLELIEGIEDRITKQDLEKFEIQAGEFVLLKTRNSFGEPWSEDFVFIEKTAASYLKDIGIRGVGIDALGVERDQPEHETHKELLGSKIIVIEGLRLQDVPEGEYLMVAAPLKVIGTEAAPARVFLLAG